MNLDDLDLVTPDDFVLDPETYQDQLPFAPPPDGTYTLRLVDADVDRDQTSGEVKGQKAENGTFYPTLLIKSVEIVDGPLAGRKIFPFQRIYTKPFMRKSATGEKAASNLADMIRSFGSDGFRGVAEGLALVKQYLEQGTTFQARTQWTAYDKEHAENLKAQGIDKKQVGKACTIRGMKKFAPDGKGGFLPQVVGPSGATLDARCEIAQFNPAKQ